MTMSRTVQAGLHHTTIDGADFSDDPVGALRAAVLVLGRRLRHQVAGDAPSATELAVLGRIGRCGPMSPGRLAAAEHVRPPSMTKIIEGLEARGLVRRDPHPTDRRQYLVSWTAEAEDFVNRSRELRTTWLAEHLAGLDESDRAVILSAVRALTRLAELP